MAVVHAAIKASPQPKACVFESLSRHSYSSKETCTQKSKRETRHDKDSQLSFAQQKDLFKHNPDLRKLFFEDSCDAHDQFRAMVDHNLLEFIDDLGQP